MARRIEYRVAHHERQRNGGRFGFEKELTASFSPDRKYAFEPRNGVVVKQYSAAFSRAYHQRLRGMVERRMRQSVYATASMWYTCWVDAGQPDLSRLDGKEYTDEDFKEFEALNQAWRSRTVKSREHEIP